jgi:DNA-binding LacI/PurR family transcriptional regulator
MSQHQPTVEDVARSAGVSIATVSRVINGTARVSQPTRDRVAAAVVELGYRPMLAARNMRRNRTGNIALIVPSITNPFFPQLVASVHERVSGGGYFLLLIDTEEPEAEAIRVANARIADGIIVVGSANGTGGADRDDAIAVTEIPIVAIDRAPRNLRTTVVQGANEDGAAEVVTHLVESGHRRIAHIAGHRGTSVAEDRVSGYLRALAENDCDYDPALVLEGDFSEDRGFALTNELMDSGIAFTAIFAANDLMAIGAIAALKERGLRVPEDVAVAGYDGIRLSRYVSPTLTTYAQPIKLIAERAIEVLLEAMKTGDLLGLRNADGGERVIRFPGELVVRESTARPEVPAALVS